MERGLASALAVAGLVLAAGVAVTAGWWMHERDVRGELHRQTFEATAEAIARRLDSLIGPERSRTLLQFLRFGVVGTVGFVVDTAVLYAGLALGLGLYGGRAVSYLAAATTTWALNRVWTFRGRGNGRVHQQWALFLVVNLIGFAMNYGTYAALIAYVPMVAAHPVLGVAAGAIAGMFGNFVLSRQLVFRARG
jgi:putative flippase GtrA